jgi:hypothetical protein
MYLGSWKIDDTVTFTVSTHTASTGAVTDADSVPTYRVYEDETSTAILTGSMAKLDDTNTTGFYSEQLTLSAANGFEKGKSYNIVIAATVGGVTGNTTRTLQIEAEVDANRLNWANVDNPTTTVGLSGTTVKTATDVETDTADIQSRLPAALTAGGNMKADALAISGDTAAADNLEAAADGTGFNLGGGSIVAASVTGNVGGNVTGSVGSLATQAKADVQAEAEEALQTYHLDHLIASADPGGVVADSSFLAKLVSKSATPAFSSYDNTTDSLEATRDRGDAAWTTATGFSTHSAADVWAVATRTLTAATNITSTGGTITVSSGSVSVYDFTTAAKALLQTEAEDALVAHRLDELLNADSDIDGAAPPTVGSVFHELMSKTAGSFTFDQTTDSLEAQRDRGDAAWTTATGFSTHSAADVWAVATRLLTAGTNIVLAKGTGVTGFNDLSAAQVNAEVDAALADVGLTTTVTGRIDAAISSVSAPTAAAVADAVWDEARTGHTTAGTFGLYLDAQVSLVSSGGLSAADIADAVWDEATSGHTTAGSYGKLAADAAAAAADAVWDEAASGHTTAGTFGKLAADAAAGAGGSDAPTAAEVADAVWGELTEGWHDDPGTTGYALSQLTDRLLGGGHVRVTHDYGGDDNLAYRTGQGQGIAGATVLVFLKEDYDAGRRQDGFARARTTTDNAGRWRHVLMLEPGDYVMVAYRTGPAPYGPDALSFAVTS